MTPRNLEIFVAVAECGTRDLVSRQPKTFI